MELLTYWKIIWRRLWLIVLIVGVVALYVGYEYYHLSKVGALKTNSSSVTIQVGLQPIDPQDLSSADMVTVSETLADALTTGPILSSSAFDTQVSQQIQADMGRITQKFGANPDLGDWQNAGTIGGAITAQRVHTLVTITVNWNTVPGAWAISNAIGEVASTNICAYLNYDIPQGSSCSTTNTAGQPIVTAKLISGASDPVTVPGPQANKPTQFIILLLVALIVAIALAFLLEYFDDRIRGKDDAAQLLQLPVFGTVPRPPSPGSTRNVKP